MRDMEIPEEPSEKMRALPETPLSPTFFSGLSEWTTPKIRATQEIGPIRRRSCASVRWMASANAHTGTSITVFLPDGNPEGVRLIFKSHWTGIAVASPRSRYPEVRLTPEALRKPGVYALWNPPTHSKAKFARKRLAPLVQDRPTNSGLARACRGTRA
jgi:hypothetical protein